MEDYRLRFMTIDDIDRICEIEQSSFTIPWPREAFENELMQNHFACYLVIEVGGIVAGYGGMWLILDEAHITNIAIAPSYRGKKWGEKLLLAMMAHALRQGIRAMTLEVRSSNIAAQGLYEKLGFKKTGIRPKYYSDNGEDALIMWVEFKNDAEKQMESKSS